MSCVRIEPRGWADCVVAAPGPSLTEAVAETVAARADDCRLVVVNDAYMRLPSADVLYAGDARWWDLRGPTCEFSGERWSVHEVKLTDKLAIAARYGVRLVAGSRQIDAPGFSLDPRRIHYGNSSGFQAINLAIHFGAKRILLVGFDMRTPGPGELRHFNGEYPDPSMNCAKYEHFLPAFVAAARTLPPTIRIVNCTPRSALRCFPMGDLEAELGLVAR